MCWICGSFSDYTSYLEFVFAINVVLGTWWTKFRRRALVDRKSEQEAQEILLEQGSDAYNRVARIFDHRELLDKLTRHFVWIWGTVIAVVALASLLLTCPDALVPSWMKFLFVLLPLVLLAVISFTVLLDGSLRRNFDGIIVADLKERMKAETELTKGPDKP